MGDYTGGVTSALESISRRRSEEVQRQAMLQAIAERDTQFQEQQQERQRSLRGRKVIEELLPQLLQLGAPPGAGAAGPQPPMPGQPSVPMAPPPAQPQGAGGQPNPAMIGKVMEMMKSMQGGQGGAPGGGMPGMPPPPGAGGAPAPQAQAAPPPAAAAPPPPPGWQALPKPPAPAPMGPGGLPPPPEDAVMPRQQLSVGELAKFLDSKGIKGEEALAAIEQWKPYMDSQNKAELDALKVKSSAQKAALDAYQRVMRDAETARHHGALEKQGDAKVAAARDKAAKAAAAGAEDDLAKDSETRRFMADQFWAGDKSVMQNLGRGVQGSRNIMALRREITKVGKEKGKTAADLAAAMAEFEGMKSGERTLGTRSANAEMAVSEAQNMAKIVLDTSSKFERSEFTPLNKALKSFEDKTGSTESRNFGAAINSFINAYARAISPTGTPTVSDKDHAREILSTADSHEQVKALMGVLQREMEAARKAPGQVKESMRSGFTGKGESREFSSEAEAQAAGVKPGDRVTINGVSGTWK